MRRRDLSCWCRSGRKPASASFGTGPVADGKPVDPKKLKALTSRIDAPPLPEISMRFAEWVARYTLAPLGMVVRMMMSADAAFEPPKHRFGVAIVEGAALPRENDRRRAPACSKSPPMALSRAKSDLGAPCGCSTGVDRRSRRRGHVWSRSRFPSASFRGRSPPTRQRASRPTRRAPSNCS